MGNYRELTPQERAGIAEYMSRLSGTEMFIKECAYANYTYKYVFNRDGSMKHNNFYDTVQEAYKFLFGGKK
mgnify:CR=1 FL=1